MSNDFTVTLHGADGVRSVTLRAWVKYAALVVAIGAFVALLTLLSTLWSTQRALAAEQRSHAALAAEKQALETKSLELIPSGSPIPYKGISSKFGYRTHPITHKRELHRGTDLRAEMDTPIRATADGIVEFAGSHNTKGYGRLVILDHAYGFRTLYGHLHKISVKNGQVLKKGDLIGYSGSSGLSNGPHLHYEVRFIQHSLNPYWFVKWDMGNFEQIFAKVKGVQWEPILQAIADESSGPKLMLSKAAL